MICFSVEVIAIGRAAVTFGVSQPLDWRETQELARKSSLLQNLAFKSRKT